MPLDMTGPHGYNRDVHYRRYLRRTDNRITVVCVQDFDYHDYEPSRFVDLKSFTSDEEGRLTPVLPHDVLEQMQRLDPDDTVGRLQGQRILRELDRGPYPVP